MPKVTHTGQWAGPMYLMRSGGRAIPGELEFLCTLHGAPWDTSFPAQDAFGSFSLPSRDLKPTNILLGDEGQPVLMDLGSMNQACIQVEGSRQALALQVRESPGFFGHLLPIPRLF